MKKVVLHFIKNKNENVTIHILIVSHCFILKLFIANSGPDPKAEKDETVGLMTQLISTII